MSTSLISKVNNWAKNIQFYLLPGTCIVCKRPSERQFDLCPACEAILPRIKAPCVCCGLPLPPGSDTRLCGPCILKPPPYQHIISALAYQAPTDRLIGSFKYRGKLAYGHVLSELLLQHIKHAYRDSPLPALIVPMPLHAKRIRQRGFNQAIEIAALLSRRLNLPMDRNLCARKRHTERQEGLNIRERKNNVKQAFKLKKSHVSLSARVAIVDDVVTTTATTGELARLLRRSGAEEVHIWSLARACRKI